MNAMQRAVTAYGQATETLAPIQQVVLLYDGAIRRIREARGAHEDGRIDDRCVAIGKAAAIIEGLQAALDHERGGEIAANLDRIYTDVAFRLQGVNLGEGAPICDELIERLSLLRQSWAALANGAVQRPSPAAPQRLAQVSGPRAAGAKGALEVTI